MDTKQARDAIHYGAIEEVTLYRHGEDPWKIHLTGDVMGKREWLELDKNAGDREFASLETAYAYVRKLGWVQMIGIDG